ncbi:MAG: hypothetical protein K5662_07915 [Lachnospiraceae bacterium]|nr:hypothetical protein [Lachnospiraceae bacterium]
MIFEICPMFRMTFHEMFQGMFRTTFHEMLCMMFHGMFRATFHEMLCPMFRATFRTMFMVDIRSANTVYSLRGESMPYIALADQGFFLCCIADTRSRSIWLT